MNDQKRKHLEGLRWSHQRRLQVLELQAANFGVSTPPHVLIEIEDLREEIASIDAQLADPKQPVPQFLEQEIISILFLSADPTDASRLRLGEELREIQEKLQLAKLRERFALEQRMSVRPADISQALLDVKPQIVHFSGHGMVTGALCFENLVGETHPVEPDTLAALFEQFADQINCVILNACYSEIQANAISKHIKPIMLNYSTFR